jgi:hypothetical protein
MTQRTQRLFSVFSARIFSLCSLWFIILFLSQSTQALAYKDKKAILVASREMQGDTIGYNIVADMARYMYAWLDSGKVKFWDSPEKKYTLTKDDLVRIENSTNTRFTDLSTLFIYEQWNARKKSFRFGLTGFSFAGQNNKGEEILYGYVEYYPGLKDLFLAAPLKVNAHGQYGMNLWQALMNKKYDYSLVYFDGVAYTDYTKSARFIKFATDKKKRQLNTQQVKETKLVEYSITGGPSEEGARSVYISDHLQKFFNQNPQEFYNYGGDAILSYQKKAPIIITDLHVQETWVKDRKGNITVTPSFVIPYIVGIPLNPIPISEFEKWNFYVDDKKLEEALIVKDFNYVITSVNETEVPEELNIKVRNALLSGSWTNLLHQPIAQKTEHHE